MGGVELSGSLGGGSLVRRATGSLSPLVLFGSLLVTACGGSSRGGTGENGDAGAAGDAPSASGGGGGSSATGGSSTGGTSGKGGGSGSSGEAGASGAGAGGAGGMGGIGGTGVGGEAGVGGTGNCNSVVNTAPVVAFSLSAGAPPTALGGRITPGIYHWISATYYGGAANCVEGLDALDIHYTVEVVVSSPTTGMFEVVLSTPGTESRLNNPYELGGTALVTTAGCGEASGATSSYTATATSLVLMRDDGEGCGTGVYILELE